MLKKQNHILIIGYGDMVKIIGSWINQYGYTMLRLSNKKCIPLHVLCWQNLHHKKLPEGFDIDHVDYNINRNCASNLRLLKKEDNIKRRWGKYE